MPKEPRTGIEQKLKAGALWANEQKAIIETLCSPQVRGMRAYPNIDKSS